MASTIRISILANARQAVSSLNDVEKKASASGKAFSGMKKLIGGALAVGGITAVVGQLKSSIDLAKANGAATRVFNAELKNLSPTAAGVFKAAQAGSVKFGESIGKNATDIQQATNALAAYGPAFGPGTLGAQGLQRATAAAFDKAAAGFGDAVGNSKLLGKALEAPQNATKALRGLGVLLNVTDAERLKTLAKQGKTVEAQKLILDAVEKSTKGVASGTATGGAKLKAAFDNLAIQLGKAVLPLMGQLAKFITENILPTVKQLVALFSGEFGKGVLTVISHPAFKTFLGIVLALGAAMKIQALYTSIAASATATFGAESAFAAAATGIWNGVMAVFNLVMAANPIVLVVLAIVALVAVIILAYKHSETFRRIVDAAFQGIKTAITSVIDFLKPFFVAAFNFYKTVWSTAFTVIRTIVMAVFNGLRAYFSFIFAVYAAVFRFVVAQVLGAWARVRAVYTIIVGVFTAVRSAVAAVFAYLVGRFQAGIAALVAVWNGVTAIYRKVIDFRNKIIGYIVGLARDFINAGRNIMQGLIDGITAGFNWVRDKLKGLGGLIPGWLQSALGISSPSKVMAKIGGQIVDGLAQGIDRSVPALRKTLGGVSDIVQSGINAGATVDLGNAQITGGGAGAGTVIQLSVTVAPTADKAAIGKEIVEALRSYQRQSGRVVLASA